jgi:hypothetical protein
VGHPGISTGPQQLLVDVHGLLGRHVQLVAELAEVRDAHAECAGEADVDHARRPERERIVRQVRRRDRLQDRSR